ncbi:MAG: nuclear transport factor 2 family protein [Hyphomonadaceae bacterium]
MRTILASLLSLVICGCAGVLPPLNPPPPEHPVVAAERAFATYASQSGWIPAFRAYAAPDGIVIADGAIASAPQRFAALPDDGDRSLSWRPALAALSQSGDLGFTTGPYFSGGEPQARGHYFTVWRLQPNGEWKWVFDGGVGVRDENPIAAGAAPLLLPTSERGVGSEARAVLEVSNLEREFATGFDIQRWLADEARVNRAGMAQHVGRTNAGWEFAPPAFDIAYTPLRAYGSAAGDMVFTLGGAEWTHDGARRTGHYARIWQYRGDGWRIVFDQLLPVEAQRASASSN